MRRMISKNVKRCRVCGDAAVCFNFNGLSCEACKVFFRRSLKNNEKFECKNNLQCVISKITRKICKRCRMDKCLEIGMKKEHALGILREKKLSMAVIQKAISENYELQQYDMLRISEIQQAMSNFPDERKAALLGTSQDVVYISNLAQYYVRNAIKFCKQLDQFKKINSSDQLSLLKHFYPEMSLIYMSFIYDRAKDGMCIITNSSGEKKIFFKMDVSPDYHPSQNLPRKFRKFATSMNVVLDNDVFIRNLLIAQLLFKPRDSSNQIEFLKYNYSVYGLLLRKYLLFKYRNKADNKFLSIMTCLKDVGKACTLFRHIYSNEMSRGEVSPILIELYDLNANKTLN